MMHGHTNIKTDILGFPSLCLFQEYYLLNNPSVPKAIIVETVSFSDKNAYLHALIYLR